MLRVGPCAQYPTDNEYGVPLLREDMQATVAPPVLPWGSVSRWKRHYGMFHCYVDDYKFSGLTKNPEQIVRSGCVAAVEPNISVFDDHPLAWAIWATYEKRRVARAWQELGVGVFVDLCVPERFMGINLVGVPRGWHSYATRGFVDRPDDVIRECEVARKRGGPGATVLVIGGGERIRALCQSIQNAVWVPQGQKEVANGNARKANDV